MPPAVFELARERPCGSSVIACAQLEEVHAVVRGELELIKKLGKEWFSTPHPDCPPEELEIANAKA